MDTHIKNDPNNPINFTGETPHCTRCQEWLDEAENIEELICLECEAELEEEEYMNTEIYKNSLENRE